MEEYAKALEIYRGDFLPLETSLPGVDRCGNELKKTSLRPSSAWRSVPRNRDQ